MSRRAVFAAVCVAAAAAAVLTACSVRRQVSDPQPTLPALTQPVLVPAEIPAPAPPVPAAIPAVVEASSAAAAAAPPPMPPPAAAAGAPAAPAPPKITAAPTVPQAAPVLASEAPPAKPRVWGLVAITTAIVSPSQLMGPEVPYSPAFKRLPVFPERLTFDVSWGLVSVGEATMNVEKIVMFNGRPAYHVVSEARSNSFCDTFYTVRDLNESWLDARTLTSLGYSKKLREGRFFRDEWVLYDRDEQTFVARRTDKDGTFHIRVGTIPAQVQDVLSSVYYTRDQELKEGRQVIVDVNTPDNWPLVVNVSRTEDVKVPAGRKRSVLVEPAMRREGLFIQKGKRLRLWLSDDAAKRPMMMKVEVFFGHITAVLREML